MQLFQSVDCHMRVDLGAVHGFVAKQHLYRAQPRAIVEHMGGKAMT